MSKSFGDRSGADGLADPHDQRSNCGVGAVVDLEGGPSHETVHDALTLLENLEHRGAKGSEPDTGDGAGIRIDRPDAFFRDAVDADLPTEYAVGSFFLPTDEEVRRRLKEVVESTLADHGLAVRAWRGVPTDATPLGETAVASEPDVQQAFVVPAAEASFDPEDDEAFERTLYVARNAIEDAAESVDDADRFYVCSLSRSTVVYKGLLTASQLPAYYPDLTDERLRSRVALVHARFSTNTLGAWHLAHPYRTIVHNGEINTVRGNVNWIRAREADLDHEAFDGDDLAALTPVTTPEGSDTASVDHVLELLLRSGRSLPHALRTLVPEAFRGDDDMSEARQAFYDYHASVMEPWDGPALILGYDGGRLAGVLDRNGLRPCRYERRTDGRVVLASEAGALGADPGEVVERDRLAPGELLVVDPDEGRIVPDDEVFGELTDERYAEWVDDGQRHVDELIDDGGDDHAVEADHAVEGDGAPDGPGIERCQAAFGYTRDDVEELVEPMATGGSDPVGSMGDDTPLTALSAFDRPLFTYFKQLFAQVSNPPIDYIREELVTSVESRLGPQNNLLSETAEHARQIVLDSPVLDADAAAALKGLDGEFESAVLDATFPADADLESAVDDLRAEARAAVADGADIVVLSDRALGADRLAIPSLLATGAVHHGLVRAGLRARCGLVVEAGDVRAVHHLACLVGYGAGGVVPYLAHETVRNIASENGTDPAAAIEAFDDALEDGLLKTTAKMGISTVESYQGAQIFEAVGVDSGVVAEYFEGTPIRTEGVDLDAIEATLRERHAVAFEDDGDLERRGEYEYRSGGVSHGWNPETVGALQKAVRSGEYDRYQEFADRVDAGAATDAETLRGLLEFDSDRDPIPVEEVEPLGDVVERFSTAAMSLGSLSPEAHENNALATNRIGAKSNTGEGGEPPERFGTERGCPVKQVASGRFGVTATYLSAAEEIQIKMAQGSKPGEGGHLPGRKVNEMIAHVRYATPGVGLISPPPQHDIYSIEDLKQLIHDLKAVNPDADVNVKLVSEAGVGTVAAGVAKAGADTIHVSGHSGGTGASPKTSIKNAGLPWELGVAEANQLLQSTGLRDRVRLSTDGGMRTGRDVAVAAALGAEEFVFGTASLVSSGCVMARVCHTNNCPVGVATQDEDLRERFPGTPEHVMNYLTFVAQDVREILADLGLRSVDELVGRPDCLTQREGAAAGLDLSAILAAPTGDGERTKSREHVPEDWTDRLDDELLSRPVVRAAIEDGDPGAIASPIDNGDRAVGAALSGVIAERHGVDGLAEGTLVAEFDGTAGQSFGAFLAPGVRLELSGVANDYVGKGLSGGTVVVSTPETAGYDPTESVVAGNVCLYGATGGEAYVNGVAGERFAVRNSGAKAVVEGAGDHCCEYMTGGVVVVLGETGRNFGAGMSGGVAYVYDPDGDVGERVNPEMVSVARGLTDRDERIVRRLVENHAAYADSDRAAALLSSWEEARSSFVRVFPDAYAEAVADGSADIRTDLPAPAGAADHRDDAAGAISGDD